VGYHHLLGPPPGLTGPPQPLWGGAAKLVGARFTPVGSFESVFPDRLPLVAGNYLEVFDPHGNLVQRIGA
jgi:hypothetical protein